MAIYPLRNLIIGYTLAIVVVLLIILYTFSTLRSQEKALGKIQRSREAMQVLGPSLVNMQELESNLLNYANSADKKDIDFYNEWLTAFRNDSVYYSRFVNDNETYKNYQQLLNIQQQMKDYAARIIRLYNTGRAEVAKAELNKNTTTNIIKDFKTITNRLEDNNRQIISSSYNHTIELTRKTFSFVKAIAAVLLVVLAISFYFRFSDIKKKSKAEAQLKKFNEDLENQVNEKTLEIRKSEEKLSLIYNTTTDIIFLISIVGKQQYQFDSVNKAFLSVTGLKKEQVIGKYISEVIPKPSLAIALKNYEQAIQIKKPVSWEETSDYPSGKKIGIVTIAPVFNEEMECTMLVGAVHDISERKKAEQELAEAESKFRNLVEQSLVGVYIIQDGRFAYVNPRFAQIFGYVQAELIGSNPIEIIMDSDKMMVAENVRARVAGEKESVHYEADGKTKNGNIIRIEVFCSGTLYDGSSAIIGTILDITERKKAEEEIMKANERFHLIAKATNDAVWDWDMITDRNWGNDIFYQYYGIQPDSDSNNETFLTRVHPDDKERLLEELKKAIDSKAEQILDEFRFRMPDGSYRHFYDRAYIIYNEEGKAVRMLGSMMDMTEIKKAEAEKEKARYLLNERVKELTTLYQSGQVLQMEFRPIKEVLQEIVAILPQGWQYPEITAARIILDDMEFTTFNFTNGVHQQSADFTAPDGKSGKIEVIYLEQKPDAQEGPFLAEERDLINMLANMLKIYLARRHEAEALKKSEANLHTIFDTTDTIYVLLNKDFRIISFNQRFFDFTAKELNIEPAENDYLPDYLSENRRIILIGGMKKALHGDHTNYEITYPQANGAANWYYTRILPITNKENDVLGLMLAISDITEKKLMEKEMLDQKVQEQKRITRAVLKAEEKERNKIGQELHDNVNQILAGTKLYLSMVEKDKLVKNDLVKSSIELIDSAIQEIRTLSKNQVTPLKQVNLEQLIYSLIDKLNDSASVKAKVFYDVKTEIIEDDLKLNIYRIVQEQINNILKHAEASAVCISLKEDDDFLYMTIEDNGKGFNPAQKRNGIGVSNMINRVESFNGELEIESSPGNGCKLKMKVPY